MAECDWAILCDYAFLDVNRKMCLIGTFDRIFASAVPGGLHQAAIAMKLLGDANETANFRLEILRPNQSGQLITAQGSTVLGDSGTADVQFNIAGLPLPDYGVYSINVYVDEGAPRTVSFQVMKPPNPPPAAT
jgi:hypothetical protein